MKSITVATIVMLGVAGALSGQSKGAPARPVRTTPMSHPTKGAAAPTTANKPEEHSSFRGIANKLGTTPDALESAYQAAKTANPKLTRGQFVSANMVAHNLGTKNSAITTDAILNGLKGGKSLGQTLQGLGLTAKEAEDAERQARRDAAAAQRS